MDPVPLLSYAKLGDHLRSLSLLTDHLYIGCDALTYADVISGVLKRAPASGISMLLSFSTFRVEGPDCGSSQRLSETTCNGDSGGESLPSSYNFVGWVVPGLQY